MQPTTASTHLLPITSNYIGLHYIAQRKTQFQLISHLTLQLLYRIIFNVKLRIGLCYTLLLELAAHSTFQASCIFDMCWKWRRLIFVQLIYCLIYIMFARDLLIVCNSLQTHSLGASIFAPSALNLTFNGRFYPPRYFEFPWNSGC